MKEIAVYTVVTILILLLAVVLNASTNKMLIKDCAKRGGTIHLAVADAGKTQCEIK